MGQAIAFGLILVSISDLLDDDAFKQALRRKGGVTNV